MSNEIMPPKPQTCPALGTQTATVCLPVTICPHAITGPAKIHCFGEPVIKPCQCHCKGKPNGRCTFTISQKIKVEIPVEFGATVDIGETFIDCDCPKDRDFDDDYECEPDMEDLDLL